MSPRKPPLSVVMPVHNALPYLDEAIESIVDQTFGDFEFVILDDGSTDGSTERLREWASREGRIRLLEAKENLGPVRSSQRVAEAASAAIVARMDADDISHRNRLHRQMEVLRDNPEVGLVAALCELIDQRGRRIRNAELWRLARRSPMAPFAHGSIMYRRAIFDRVGGYREDSRYWEDQDLVQRMSRQTGIAVIPEPLLKVRQTTSSTRFAAGREGQEQSLDSMYAQLPGASPKGAAGKLDPRVFVSMGSVELWAGGRPRLFRKLLRQGALSPSRTTIAALGWTAWASLSPSTLRASLRALAGVRDAVARRRLDLRRPVPWSPQPRVR